MNICIRWKQKREQSLNANDSLGFLQLRNNSIFHLLIVYLQFTFDVDASKAAVFLVNFRVVELENALCWKGS